MGFSAPAENATLPVSRLEFDVGRQARFMIPDCPFHITHRGNRKQRVFHSDSDRLAYLARLRWFAEKFGASIWAYCLMDNHIHLIATGRTANSISKTIGMTHGVTARAVHRRIAVTGHLWANRFFSTALDTAHLWAAVRYVEMNPVRAGVVSSPIDYQWSSARSNAGLETSKLLAPDRPFPGGVEDWAGWLTEGVDLQTDDLIRANTATGRPTGSDSFVAGLPPRPTETSPEEQRSR